MIKARFLIQLLDEDGADRNTVLREYGEKYGFEESVQAVLRRRSAAYAQYQKIMTGGYFYENERNGD